MPFPDPVLLALDTATERLHVALAIGDDVRTMDLPGGAQASSTLLPALADLLKAAGRSWPDVQAIAFGNGPGAFTGLRTACSVTQGLALGLSCPVIAIDTLMAVAEDARLAQPEAWAPGDTLWVLQDARMAELYVGAFTWDGQEWAVHSPAQLWPLTGPAQHWALHAAQDAALSPGRWAGNAGRAYPDQLAPLMAWQCQVPQPPEAAQAPHAGPCTEAAPRGQALARLAQRAWARGDTLDAALALPRYVRDKVAQTTAERQAARPPGVA